MFSCMFGVAMLNYGVANKPAKEAMLVFVLAIGNKYLATPVMYK